MACENLSKYYPIVMKFSGAPSLLPLAGVTSAIDFGPDRSIPLAGHTPKLGHNELDCSSVCEWDINFQRRGRYVLFSNLFPKWDRCPKVGHFLNVKWC